MFGLRKSNGLVIPEEEWNFSEILELDAETCLRYELAREIVNPESYFASFDSGKDAPFSLEPWSLSPQQEQAAGLTFKLQRATMLIRPFDAIDQGQKFEMREMLPGLYFLHDDGSCRAYPAGLLEKPWLGLDDDWQANLQNYAERFLTGVSFFPASDLPQPRDKCPNQAETVSQIGAWQVFAAKIDWRKNDSSLIEGFTSWLRRERPKSIPSMVPIGGRQSIYDSLNALSALRLRHQYSIEDAIKCTKSVLRKPLYRDRSSWDRAQRRAIQLFTKEFPGAGSPRSETKISNRKILL